METFFITFLLTTTTLLGCGLLINYCRKKMRQTGHGLTAMCHKTGGKICTSCSEAKMEPEKQPHRPSTNTTP
ncbi:MAG: hypothetical protein OEV64_05710 [Desulfobulbaceae bacterium]|nr:hypothetical protein [Desulfobulbaceae bacterium]